MVWARAASGLLVGCLCVLPVRADVFVWTDANGRVHMTDDLSQVPADQRRRAEAAGERAADSTAVQHLEMPQSLPAPTQASAGAAPTEAAQMRGGRTHVLKVERAGNSMRVVALLNDRLAVPFILDTGAEGCTIPRWAAEEMGFVIDETTPRKPVAGISGRAVLAPIVEVSRVQVGTASVESVEMIVLDTMSEGLLGMPFYNHFRAQTDPTSGILRLEEIDLDSLEGVYGGRNESSWRSEFRMRRAALEGVRRMRAQTRDEAVAMHADLDRQERYWEEQLEQLELKARRVGVPTAWRQ